MIEYLSGTLAELTPTEAVVECHGVAYAVAISLNTYTALQGKTTVKVYVYESIREDAYQLFGFATKSERSFFTLLVGVSGVGGATARMILSSFTAGELSQIIASSDDRAMRSVKGIGPKVAQRIIMELRDKLPSDLPTASETPSASATAPSATTAQEAVEALMTLGFPPAPSKRAVQTLMQRDPAASLEDLIKQALKML